MISELVNELRVWEDRMNDVKNNICPTGEVFKKAADAIEELYKKLHSLQMERSSMYYNGGLIPCSERLPEENTRVLTMIKVNKCQANVRSGYYSYKMFHNDNGDCWKYDDKEVIAWMPLPEPYKEIMKGD